MAYLIDANEKNRYFGLVFTCSGDAACSGKICVIDSYSQRLIKILPILALVVLVLFIMELATLAAPWFSGGRGGVNPVPLHITVLLGSVCAVVVESLIVIAAWLRAVRARAFCTKRIQLKIDLWNSYALYSIPVIVFANSILVMLWVRTVPEYGGVVAPR